ncbi:hypothetical protein [Psychrobacter sp. Cmf 22.2]|uniref:hypothetical protein n=1 Tax=Psychrobacter sp. Cmf 22.2 TaxID=1926478 RepID=UPI0009471BC6|nr:hypothetical protein [Psychrobacter sp. Cmf 22.2]OLF36658.1 hypothetical protein BTV98_09565 [Psychrobacter sp. Cmf 22.2]
MSRATLSSLDSSLYPQVWGQLTFADSHGLLMALLMGDLALEPNDFTKRLLANDTYQDWINATVFGRYIQRSFEAFYRQTEDSFNMDMPALFRAELLRHAQYLPLEQVLFIAGTMPKSARLDKLFTTTVNPATAVLNAQKVRQEALRLGRENSQTLIVNQIKVVGKQAVGFPIRHNKRTSERTRNEVLILDFDDLRLVNEQILNSETLTNTAVPNDTAVVLRYYELR